MTANHDIEQDIHRALLSEPRIGLHEHPLDLKFEAGTLTMEGEVVSVAAKKLALERAAALPEVLGIVDRVHVVPAQPMGDREIRDHLRDALLQEPAFLEHAIAVIDKGSRENARRPDAATGYIEISVDDGIVTLNGDVPSLARKRLIGVLAWWVPGSRDVVNGLAVTPPEEDSDEAIADALALVLEKDPFVNASQIRIGVRRSMVTLTGVVPADSEREMAEFDAWYVFGVDAVDNRIDVHP